MLASVHVYGGKGGVGVGLSKKETIFFFYIKIGKRTFEGSDASCVWGPAFSKWALLAYRHTEKIPSCILQSALFIL